MATKSVVKSAASVRAKVPTSNPKAPKKLRYERPTTGGGIGGNRQGTDSRSNLSVTKGGASAARSIKHAKAAERVITTRSALVSQTNNLTLPTPSVDEKEYLIEYVHLFRTLRKMIRKSEARYMEGSTSKEVYALMTMYSQLREVISDIRSISDMTQHADTLIQGAVQPSISNIAQHLVDMFYHIRVLIREVGKDDQIQYSLSKIDDMMRDSGMLLQDQYTQISNKIHDILLTE